jgi:hypothetical protein
MTSLDSLEARIRNMLAVSSVDASSVRIELERQGGRPERLKVERTQGAETRYIELRDCHEDVPAWNYVMLLGAYGRGAKEIDARRGGDEDYAFLNVERWIVDFCPWADMPPFI